MAGSRLLHVLLCWGRKLRAAPACHQFDQPQFRKPSGPRDAVAPCIARNGGGVGGRGRHRRSAGAVLMKAFTTLTAIAAPLIRDTIHTDAIIPPTRLRAVTSEKRR